MHLCRFHFLIALLCAAALAILGAPLANAQGPNPAQVENKTCLACHANRDLAMKLPGGETLSVYTDEAQFNASVHGKRGQRCTTCHANITAYPHPAVTARDRRDYALQMYTVCRQCHEKVYQQAIDSIHSKDIAAGNRNAAVCTDCHTAHYTTDPHNPRSKIPQTCRQCHSTIFDQYKSSVHGAALLDQSNPDVPTCVECHGVHQIADPTTNAFRLKSPELCATCHTDRAKMKKYNLSTNVLNTYVADFHGSTVELFEKQSPDAPTNKAVCYDCHGVHDIRSAKDPKSSVVKENLLKTCQQCHPDATTDFPSSWMSHYDASPTKYPAVYYINLFYTILIPVVIGGMLAFVLLDAARRILNRFQKPGSHSR
ncbi:MAG: cytochrome C [Chloroflexi bacterium]|nr:cytochrome C [Chloroflexota bacterium]